MEKFASFLGNAGIVVTIVLLFFAFVLALGLIRVIIEGIVALVRFLTNDDDEIF